MAMTTMLMLMLMLMVVSHIPVVVFAVRVTFWRLRLES
jgi:hypothetical protein